MLTMEGIATSPGIAKGHAFIIDVINDTIALNRVSDTKAEYERVLAAIEIAKQQLSILYEKALIEVGEEVAAIFDIHTTMLEDEDFLDCIHDIVQSKSSCGEYAVQAAGKQFSSIFSNMDDEYMRERAADVLDLSRRIVAILTGCEQDPLKNISEPVIIAAEDLMPSQTIQIDKSRVLAFISKKGSMNSHAAILARSLGIPAVAALNNGFSQIKSGDFLIIDGINGLVIIDPDIDTLHNYDIELEKLNKERLRLRSLVGTKAVTKDGVSIEICANIGHTDECSQVLDVDADGIGLFRSEFLFLESNGFPSEETQFWAYTEVLERMSPKKVIIRTLDLGADKQAPYFQINEEANPALGYRAIRICLDRPEIFIPQLRALLRASIYGKLGIMFPMITGIQEVHNIYTVLNTVKKDLDLEGIPYSAEIEYGIMIETPSAVMVADRLAREVDFFSIGTNDLTQYTLACDRMNTKLSYLYDSSNISVMRMIKHTVDMAHQNGIWVGICGESAGNVDLLPYYIAMGIDELSVSAPFILKVKESVQALVKSECIKQCNAFFK